MPSRITEDQLAVLSEALAAYQAAEDAAESGPMTLELHAALQRADNALAFLARRHVGGLVGEVQRLRAALAELMGLVDSGYLSSERCTCYSIDGCEYCGVVTGVLGRSRRALGGT